MRFTGNFDGVPGTTFTQTSTDTAVVLTAASLLSSDGNRAISVLISCQTNAIRFAFNATPVAGAGGLGHDIDDGEWMYIRSSAAVKAMKIVSATSQQHGVLTITPFFEPGR
jgi:hypothetical protein